MYGDLDLLKRLEATGADLDAPDTHSFNWTPLMAAVIHRQTDVVQYLLTRKISLDSQDLWGQTVLMWAIRTSDTNTVWRLLEKGANPAIRDKAGVTALGHAETSPHRVALSKWLKEHHPAGRQSN
jgi:ankyrin repeat protein